MLREQRAPSGPRPADFTPSRNNENRNASSPVRSRAESGSQSILTASSRNNHSLFSFGGQGGPEELPSFDFPPSLNFDDLQSSLLMGIDDFQDTQTAPVEIDGQVGGIGAMGFEHPGTGTDSSNGTTPTTRPGPGPALRQFRTGSIARRQSTSTRQSSMSSTVSSASVTVDPQSTALALRNRRQNQYPPISGIGPGSKKPRNSIGSGGVDAQVQDAGAPRRRPSMGSSGPSLGDGAIMGRATLGAGNTATEGARLASARAAKAKSLQPAARQTPTHLSAPVSTPDHSRSSSFAGRSPGRSYGKGTLTPSLSSKRMSTMPGMPSSSHASGLGARTISPTDARRAKRMSTINGPPPLPQTPTTPQLDAAVIRAASRSPSVVPRKTSTPSSSRTTPDINRKSYSSGLSVGSTNSFNTARTSTGSLQPRLPQTASTSRLPTPKPNTTHRSEGNDEEEVPPVPAIPKAYESPKESPPDQPFFTKRKSSLPYDTSSINSNTTNEIPGPPVLPDPVIHDPVKIDQEYRAKKNAGTETQQKANGTAKRKNLQPLRLPPLNLLPLSTPTAAKIAALPSSNVNNGTVTPPPKRGGTKTPSTPMTASKSSFFSSRNRQDDREAPELKSTRSNSSFNHGRAEPSSIRNSSTSQPMPIPNSRPTRQAVSPFVSSSLPKSSGEYSFMLRPKTSGDYSAMESGGEQRPPRLTGPRAQKLTKPKSEAEPQVSSDEPTTPSSTSSLRRKLSLGWKRTTSKSNITSHAANERGSEYPPQPPKHDNMPPPKLPASASMNLNNINIPSPTPSVKSTTYLDSKRRKSSISSLNHGGHDRTHSDTINFSPKKDALYGIGVDRPRLTPRTSSSVLAPMHKMLGSKSSTTALRTPDRWTIDLDKDDLIAEDEMKKLASKRKETENAARILDALRKRATPKEKVTPEQAIQVANLNIYERGEIVDYKDIYFCGTQSAAKHVGDMHTEATNFGYDDERGDYSIIAGDHICYRYEIVDVLGKGSFGQVVRAVDHKTGGLVAVKIIRNKKRFHQQALVEVNILQKLREWDPRNKHSMVNFTQSFYFRGHLCISTELLDMNLYEFIKSNGFRGFSLKLIRRFTKQLLSSLLLLKQHRVIHCDLKPENILLTHPMHSEIKVIDFGSSCFENEKVYTYIQSRFYRSPEVILGMTYGMPIDMWSVGCILAELFTGYPIFPGENEQEQLACIMEVFGPPEKHLIEKSTRKKLFFDSLGKPRLTVSSKGRRRKPSSKTLQQVLKCEDEAFIDFLAKCLKWDPDRRLKPDEAVRHEFLTGQKSAVPAPTARLVTARNASPVKRYNSVAVSATNGSSRPLPEPPATSFRNGVGARQNPGASPSKPGLQRRQSTSTSASFLGSSTGSGAGSMNKRTSIGGAALAGANSSLPRVTTRSVSARQDSAIAGANAAMTRKA